MNQFNTENNTSEEIMTNMQEKENRKKLKKPGKKTVRRIVVGAILLAVLGGGAAVAVERVEASQDVKAAKAAYTIALSQAEAAGTTVISMDEAKQAAFDAAGVTEAEVRFLQAELDLNNDRDDRYDRDENNGKAAYEIEFRYGGLEYEFEIDAETGAILSYEVD